MFSLFVADLKWPLITKYYQTGLWHLQFNHHQPFQRCMYYGDVDREFRLFSIAKFRPCNIQQHPMTSSQYCYHTFAFPMKVFKRPRSRVRRLHAGGRRIIRRLRHLFGYRRWFDGCRRVRRSCFAAGSRHDRHQTPGTR